MLCFGSLGSWPWLRGLAMQRPLSTRHIRQRLNLRRSRMDADARRWGKGNTSRLSTRDIPAEAIALVDEAQGGRFCVYCRLLALTPPASEPLEIDHKQPLSKGGDNHYSNLQWLCRSHNRSRNNRRPSKVPIVPRWARGPQ